MKNKLIIKILLHVVPWSIAYILPRFVLGIDMTVTSFRMQYMFHINFFLLILFFYLNKYFFIPYFLSKQKLWHYGTVLIFSLIFSIYFTKVMFSTVIPTFDKNYYAHLEDVKRYLNTFKNAEDLESPEKIRQLKQYYNNYAQSRPLSHPFRALFVVIVAFAVSTSLTITRKWYQNELQKKEMAKEQFETELMFLKSQVNPHFLFNTLNGIYSLANKKSDKTADAIVKLSSLIRYMLYDSNKELVNLEEELEYIRNYIDLQRIRFHSDVKFDFQVDGEVQVKQVAPMLLIPFIENAFKYGVNHSDEPFVDIKIFVDKSELKLKVINKINLQKPDDDDENSGLGLKNVKRRLQLLYPEKHLLNIEESDGNYMITLTLILNHYEMLNS